MAPEILHAGSCPGGSYIFQVPFFHIVISVKSISYCLMHLWQQTSMCSISSLIHDSILRRIPSHEELLVIGDFIAFSNESLILVCSRVSVLWVLEQTYLQMSVSQSSSPFFRSTIIIKQLSRPSAVVLHNSSSTRHSSQPALPMGTISRFDISVTPYRSTWPNNRQLVNKPDTIFTISA